MSSQEKYLCNLKLWLSNMCKMQKKGHIFLWHHWNDRSIHIMQAGEMLKGQCQIFNFCSCIKCRCGRSVKLPISRWQETYGNLSKVSNIQSSAGYQAPPATTVTPQELETSICEVFTITLIIHYRLLSKDSWNRRSLWLFFIVSYMRFQPGWLCNLREGSLRALSTTAPLSHSN